MPEDFDDPDDRPRPRRRRDDDDGYDDRPRSRRDDDYDDEYDDRPRRRRRPPNPMDDPAMGLVLPTANTSALAIAAGYIGIFSAFLCFPSPIALILGILALRQLRRNPKLVGYGRAIFGIVTGGIGTALLVFFVVAAAIGGLK